MDFLVCIDCQNDFITGSLGSKEAIEVLPRIVDKVKNWNDKVLFTMDVHGENYLDTLEGKHLPIEHCIVNETNGWWVEESLRNLQEIESCDVIYKNRFGSFNLVRNINALNNNNEDNIDSITLVGYCTDICILVNAMILRTAFPNTEIVVDASCCAGSTQEAHEAALLVMKNCQIKVINE